MRSKYFDIILALALCAMVVSGFAYTWNSTTNYYRGPLGVSADGRVICAVSSSAAPHPSTSTNWGQTFTVTTNNSLLGALGGHVAVSANGTKIVAYLITTNGLGGGVFASYDYGANWTKMNVPGMPTNTTISLASSADGSKLVAAASNGPLFFSTNSGANWQKSSVPNLSWASVASSVDGGRVIGAATGSFLLFSTDFGATWSLTGLPAQAWKSVCISDDGKWVGAMGSPSIYISSDAAVTWTTNTIEGATGTAIACSANGSNWVITGSQVYTSTNGAATWQTDPSTGQGMNCAISADGCELVVPAIPSGMMIGRVTPSPLLGIQATNGNIGISWLIPSTNFVLQQSSDLTSTNWLPIASSPVLNFSNLHDEVAVPNTASNSFFRLIAQ